MSLMNDDALGVADQRRVFRDRLLKKMREQSMRSVDLSRASKISKDSISSYVTMRSLPGKDNLNRLCKVLKCKPSDLIPNGEEPESRMALLEGRRSAANQILVVRLEMPAAEAAKVFAQLVELRNKYDHQEESETEED